MRVTNISDIPGLEHKEAIPSVKGTLTKIWDYKEGEGEHGAYSFQNGTLQDATGTIKIVFSNQGNMKGYLNREISIQSFSGDKGLSGIYAHDNVYKGATTREIKVTSTADVSLVSGDAPKVGKEPTPRKSEAETAATGNNPVSAINRKLAPLLNAIYLIELAVKKESEQAEIDGVPFDAANFGGKCAQAFRYLDPADIKSLPATPLWSAEKPLEKQPPTAEDETPW